jgi:hypothetical protein
VATAAAPAVPAPDGPLVLTPGAAPGAADPKDKAAAASALEAGKKALAAGKLAEALAKFRESYALVAAPEAYRLAVRTVARMGRVAEAYELAFALVDELGKLTPPDPQQLAAAHEELAQLRAAVALVTVRVPSPPPDARVLVDGRELAREGWDRAFAVAPGVVRVEIAGAAGSDAQTITAVAGGTHEVALRATAVAPPPPPVAPIETPDDAGWTGPDRRILALAGAGVAVVGLIGFGTFGLLSEARYERLEEACGATRECEPELEDQADAGRTFQILANVSLGVALAGAAAGVGFFVWDYLDRDAAASAGDARRESLRARARTAVGVRVAAVPGGLVIGGRF